MGMNLNEMVFPLENFAKRENPETRRCTSFGEAAAMIANDPDTFGIINFFKCFYNRFSEESTIWFAYHDDNNDYENPFKFQLDSWRNDDYGVNSMKAIIASRILPANFAFGRGPQHSSSIIHQLWPGN